MSAIQAAWERENSPNRGLFRAHVRELWSYRDLVWLFARRNISAQYKQTVLGPLWFVLQPLLTTLVFSFIFGRLAGLGTDGVPHFLFYMGGLVLFSYFSDLVNRTSLTFTRNAALFGKVYFPRLAIPLSQVLTSLAAFTVQFSVFLIGLVFYLAKSRWLPDAQHPIHLDPNWRVLLLPVLLAEVTLLGLGVGLLVASLTTRYRDLQMAVGFGLQLWMFCSCVAFPLSDIKGPEQEFYRHLLNLNPLVPVIEAFRLAFIGRGSVAQSALLASLAISLGVFCLGLLMFKRSEQTVMDTI